LLWWDTASAILVPLIKPWRFPLIVGLGKSMSNQRQGIEGKLNVLLQKDESKFI
jgi:hypothetical protein